MNTDWIPTLLELAGAPVPAGLDGISFARGLTDHVFPRRPMFWHFPHYTNQGSRPSGAMREGNWLLVELYDEEKAELYDLSVDVSEKRDVAARHPDRTTSMRAALDAWRKENNVQGNRVNPDCAEDQFRALYQEVDASRFDPVSAHEAEWEKIHRWREMMDKAVRPRG